MKRFFSFSRRVVYFFVLISFLFFLPLSFAQIASDRDVSAQEMNATSLGNTTIAQPAKEEITNNDLINAVRAGGGQHVDAHVEIIKLLQEVKRGNISPETFYKRASQLEMPAGKELRHVLMEVKRDIGNYLGKDGLRAVFGELYAAGGSAVEAKILTYRKEKVMQTIKKAIEIYAKKNPKFSLYYAESGSWPNEALEAMKFASDMDFNFLSGDLESAMALKDIFDGLIEDEFKCKPEDLDIPCTVHGMATPEVYMGKPGQSVAEQMTKLLWEINFDESKGPIGIVPREKSQVFKEAIKQMIEEARLKGSTKVLDDLSELKWPDQPGIVLEMIRHFERDIAGKNVYTDLESFVKAAKMVDRALKYLADSVTANDSAGKKLRALAASLTEAKTDPKKQVDLIREYFGGKLPVDVDLTINADGKGKATLKANEQFIRDFWDLCRKSMWKCANDKIKKITAEFNQKITALADTDSAGAKKIYDELVKYQEMLEVEDVVLRDEKTGIPEHLDAEYKMMIGEFRSTVKAFKQKIAKNGLLKNLDPEKSKVYEWITEMIKLGKEFNIKLAGAALMSATGKTNDLLDYMDDNMLNTLRHGKGEEYINILRKGQGYSWGEQADQFFKGTRLEGKYSEKLNQWEAECNSQLQGITQWLNSHLEGALTSRGLKLIQGAGGALATGVQNVNNSFNRSVAASRSGQTLMKGMMIYNLKEELSLYYDLLTQGDGSGLAAEFFQRRVPFGGAVERGVMGDYYGVAWEITSTLIPPVALVSAAASVSEYIVNVGFETYFDEELETFIDTLYEGAKLEVVGVEKVGEDIKISKWKLLSVAYNAKSYNYDELLQLEAEGAREMQECLQQPSAARSACFPMEKMGDGLFEWWRNRDAFERAFRRSDPWIQMIIEMEKDPLAGPKLKELFQYQKYARLEQIKVEFLKRIKVKFEERRAGEQSLLNGQFLQMYDELLKIAEELDIRVQLEAVINEKFGGGVVQFLTWMKDYLHGTIREMRGDADVWDIYEELSAFVTKNLGTYKKIHEGRGEAERQLSLSKEDQGLRLLTGPYFLKGDSSEDEAASKRWVELPARVKDAMVAKLGAIKRELKVEPAALDLNDNSYDRGILDQLVYHDSFREMWKQVNSVFTDIKIPSYLGKSPSKQTVPNAKNVMKDQTRALERFSLHAKRAEEILGEFRKHYASQKTEEIQRPTAGSQLLPGLLAQMQALEGQGQAIAGEISSLEKTFNEGLKDLTKVLERASKEIMSLAKDLSSLESLANKMDAKKAEASKAADDAYSAGSKCAVARGEVENQAMQVCQLAQSIKGTDNVQQINQFIEQLRPADSGVHSQSDIFRQELNNARISSRQAETILKEMGSLREDREEAKAKLLEKQNMLPAMQAQLSTLESYLVSLQGKIPQLQGIVGEASGIVGQVKDLNQDQFTKDDKKTVKEIQAVFARISKMGTLSERAYDNNKDKLGTPADKLKNLENAVAEAKGRIDSLLSFQINDEAIGKIRKFSEEARASYDSAQLFDDPVREALKKSEACAREAEKIHAQKTSPEAQVAQTDCSQWPGTVAKWDSAKKAPKCECTPGNLWDESLLTCVSEEQYYVSRTDCSGYSNAHPGWDAAQRKAYCYCNNGYEWNNARTNCRVSAQVQVAQANCSAYPNTLPAWDASIESVRCNCVNGYYWDGSRCVYQQQQPPPPQYPQGGAGQDFGQALGGLINAINRGVADNGGGSTNTQQQTNPWNNQPQQQQGDPCEGNFYMSGYAMACGCSGYTWSTSQNKCVPGGATTTQRTTNTGSGWVNQGYTGGSSTSSDSNSGGVDTSSGLDPDTSGGILGTGPSR